MTIAWLAIASVVCIIFGIGAWYVNRVFRITSFDANRVEYAPSPVLHPEVQRTIQRERDKLAMDRETQRVAAIVNNVRQFFGQRPRPWLSPNARARKMRGMR